MLSCMAPRCGAKSSEFMMTASGLYNVHNIYNVITTQSVLLTESVDNTVVMPRRLAYGCIRWAHVHVNTYILHWCSKHSTAQHSTAQHSTGSHMKKCAVRIPLTKRDASVDLPLPLVPASSTMTQRRRSCKLQCMRACPLQNTNLCQSCVCYTPPCISSSHLHASFKSSTPTLCLSSASTACSRSRNDALGSAMHAVPATSSCANADQPNSSSRVAGAGCAGVADVTALRLEDGLCSSSSGSAAFSLRNTSLVALVA